MRRGLPRGPVALPARWRDGHAGGAGRGRARADLEDAQGRLRGYGSARRRTTTCRTRSSRAPGSRRCSPNIERCRRSTGCAWPTSSTRATATCTRWCCFDAANEGEAERAEELAGLIVKACVEEGGSITGEHGVGVDKKRYMPSSSPSPTSRRSRSCAARSTRTAWPTPASSCRRPGCAARCRGRTGSTRSRRQASPSAFEGRAAPPRGYEDAAAQLRDCARAARRVLGGRTKIGWGRVELDADVEISTSASTGSSSTTRATSPRSSRRACRSRRAQSSSRRRARCSRSTRRTWAAPRSAASWRAATPGRCATATAPRATSSWA